MSSSSSSEDDDHFGVRRDERRPSFLDRLLLMLRPLRCRQDDVVEASSLSVRSLTVVILARTMNVSWAIGWWLPSM